MTRRIVTPEDNETRCTPRRKVQQKLHKAKANAVVKAATKKLKAFNNKQLSAAEYVPSSPRYCRSSSHAAFKSL
jgi:hypothetical protein